MKILSFGTFEAGMQDDPSREDVGGFEFASGMDVFSEPGVMKAAQKLKPIIGVTPDAASVACVVTPGTSYSAFIAMGDKLIKAVDNTGEEWAVFLTNGNGGIIDVEVFAGYVLYASAQKLGRAPVGNAAAKNDDFQNLNQAGFHPMGLQAGTLKIGNGRYVGSLSEAFAFTPEALKIPIDYQVKTLAEHLTKAFIGVHAGAVGAVKTTDDASVFDWRGIVLSSGSALPDTPYPIKMRTMNALFSDGRVLYAFPGEQGHIFIYDGVGFTLLRKVPSEAVNRAKIIIRYQAVTKYEDTVLFGGEMTSHPGIFQLKGTALCQTFVPSAVQPGADSRVRVGFIKSSFEGRVLVGYINDAPTPATFHIEINDPANKQNNALCRTLWHRAKTDRLKRWEGIKLNLKPLASNTAVAVSYRTERNAAFTSAGTITPANQDKPILLLAKPRSREVQWRFVYTTNGNNTPELLSYNLLYEIISSSR